MKNPCPHINQAKIVLETVVTLEKTVIICKDCKKQLTKPVIEV